MTMPSTSPPPQPPPGSGSFPPPGTRDEGGLKGAWSALPKAGKVAAISAVLSFVVRLTYHSTATRNGVITDCTYIDYGGIVFGVAAVIAGITTLAKARSQTRRGLVIAVGVVAMVVGGYSFIRGNGAFHYCELSESSAEASSAARDPSARQTVERAREQLEEREEPEVDEADGTAISDSKRKRNFVVGTPVTHKLTLRTIEGRLIEYTVPRG